MDVWLGTFIQMTTIPPDNSKRAVLRRALLKIAAEVDWVGAEEFARLTEEEADAWDKYISFHRSLDAAENKNKH